jgi:Zn-dependent protease
MGWSLPIFRIAGIQLRIHVTFLLLIGWLAFGYYAEAGSAAAASRVLFILLLFLCVVLHEFGHAFAAKAFGINTPTSRCSDRRRRATGTDAGKADPGIGDRASLGPW